MISYSLKCIFFFLLNHKSILDNLEMYSSFLRQSKKITKLDLTSLRKKIIASERFPLLFNTIPNISRRQCISTSNMKLEVNTRFYEENQDKFPSLIISKDKIGANGLFAQTQATFLQPDLDIVKDLDRLCKEKKVGIVAHYYMDPELQGALSSMEHKHVFVADSLAMGEQASKMVDTGEVNSIICMGVDFMAESVQANLDSHGYHHVPVYRLDKREIGCSLAEAAEKDTYMAYLYQASKVPNALNVVYINTSLVTKALAQEIITTITCTSSNVVQTILTAFATKPDLNVFYGPDTYMGENLYTLFKRMATSMTDEEIQKVHPSHNRNSIENLLKRFDYFKQGNCIVHHMFGADVVNTVKEDYQDCYITAHLEVPGEMFNLAMDAQVKSDSGVVGSTSDILKFILRKTKEQFDIKGGDKTNQRLRFLLGTEAGMITSIVRGVQAELDNANSNDEIEIIFPVASDAISTENGGNELSIVPGTKGGEGCSTAGGCATCPYMKMNSLDNLIDVLENINSEPATKGLDGKMIYNSKLDPLYGFLPPRRNIPLKDPTKTVMEIGSTPIKYMREFMNAKSLPDSLFNDIASRN